MKRCSALLIIGERQIKITMRAEDWWLLSIILATWEAEMRRITVQCQLGQIVLETLS
jgi:hypothetical protein